MKRVVYGLVLILGVATASDAQTVTDERVWVGISVQARPNDDSAWKGTIEGQVRSRDGVGALEQWYVRPSVSYDLTNRVTVTAGYALFTTTPATGGTSREHRYWQQVLWTQPVAGGALAFRTRIEQRDYDGNDRLAWRFREQVRFSRPVRPQSRVSLVVWDEFSFHLRETRRTLKGFDQNRAFAGVSVTLSPIARVETGYQNQFLPSGPAPNRLNHILSGVLTLSF